MRARESLLGLGLVRVKFHSKADPHVPHREAPKVHQAPIDSAHHVPTRRRDALILAEIQLRANSAGC